MTKLNEGPDGLTELLKRKRPSVPQFRGSRLVVCKGCGRRGLANQGLLGKRQWTIEECSSCR